MIGGEAKVHKVSIAGLGVGSREFPITKTVLSFCFLFGVLRRAHDGLYEYG